MSEFRKDPILDRWVIISPERGKRPSSYGSEPVKKKSGKCPFCSGNESATPSEIFAVRDDGSEADGPGWRIRVIPNKFPALRAESDLACEQAGLYEKMNGLGVHEVIIETPRHNHDIADMSVTEVCGVLTTYQERIIELKRDKRLKHIIIFKNHGAAAGASMEHPHSQLIATPIIPKSVIEKIEGATKYFDINKSCVYCDLIKQEIDEGKRIIREYDNFISFAPYASRMPFECCIMPKFHQSGFDEMNDSELTFLAECLRDLLLRLKLSLSDPPFNYIIHTRPISKDSNIHYHWHIEIIPQLINIGGFEWGSGVFINPTSPEEAAEHFRSVEIK